eukprot:GHVP01018378.1.p1 GENE.GHVP01018378.1~~GHVP01018378.1.p1  ORF type:complete len:1622 (+),score=335.35 GHVP01018378.1:715-4866(+)
MSNFPVSEGHTLNVHIGIGYGAVSFLQLGGVCKQWDYVLAGPPLAQIAIAEPLAKNGEVCVSPETVDLLSEFCVFIDAHEEPEIPKSASFYKDAPLYILSQTRIPHYFILRKNSGDPVVQPSIRTKDIGPLEGIHSSILKRFLPPHIAIKALFGYDVMLRELRPLSVVFVGLRGVQPETKKGSWQAMKFAQNLQRHVVAFEGTLNKILVDDKGMLLLVMFGMPPNFHIDDSSRAIFTALRICDTAKALRVRVGVGVTTGTTWCGTVGSKTRREYTAMGDTVNLAARIMGGAPDFNVQCDEETASKASYVLVFEKCGDFKIKGKEKSVSVFRPTGELKSMNFKPPNNNLLTWPSWKAKILLEALLFPEQKFRPPVLLPPSQKTSVYPWDLAEPYHPVLKSVMDQGGFVLVRGQSPDGLAELLESTKLKCAIKNHSVISSTNMDQSDPGVVMGSVPLSCWRSACMQLMDKWKDSPSRLRMSISKGTTREDLLRDLVHPKFFKRIPYLYQTLCGSDQSAPVSLNEKQQIEEALAILKKLCMEESLQEELMASLRFRIRAKEEGVSSVLDHVEKMIIDQDSDNHDKVTIAEYVLELKKSAEFLGSAICSMFNCYTLYDPLALLIHVRRGTSVHSSMDTGSWKIALQMAHLAANRRNSSMKNELLEISRWRQKHSSDCPFCLNLANSRATNSCLRLDESKSVVQPFIFVLFAEYIPIDLKDQFFKLAEDCNCLIDIDPIKIKETKNLVEFLLNVGPDVLPKDFIEKVHITVGGRPATTINLIEHFQKKDYFKVHFDEKKLRPTNFDALNFEKEKNRISVVGSTTRFLTISNSKGILKKRLIRSDFLRSLDCKSIEKNYIDPFGLEEKTTWKKITSGNPAPPRRIVQRKAEENSDLNQNTPTSNFQCWVELRMSEDKWNDFPDELRTFVVSTVERLDQASKIVIKTSSLFGRPFSITELHAIIPLYISRTVMDRIIGDLATEGLVEFTSSFYLEDLKPLLTTLKENKVSLPSLRLLFSQSRLSYITYKAYVFLSRICNDVKQFFILKQTPDQCTAESLTQCLGVLCKKLRLCPSRLRSRYLRRGRRKYLGFYLKKEVGKFQIQSYENQINSVAYCGLRLKRINTFRKTERLARFTSIFETAANEDINNFSEWLDYYVKCFDDQSVEENYKNLLMRICRSFPWMDIKSSEAQEILIDEEIMIRKLLLKFLNPKNQCRRKFLLRPSAKILSIQDGGNWIALRITKCHVDRIQLILKREMDAIESDRKYNKDTKDSTLYIRFTSRATRIISQKVLIEKERSFFSLAGKKASAICHTFGTDFAIKGMAKRFSEGLTAWKVEWEEGAHQPHLEISGEQELLKKIFNIDFEKQVVSEGVWKVPLSLLGVEDCLYF